jgi:hypothetical protein
MISEIEMATHVDDIVVGFSNSMTLVRATQGAHPATGRWFLGWGALRRIESVGASRTGRSLPKTPVHDPNAFRASLKASIGSHRHPSSPSLLFHDWLP